MLVEYSCKYSQEDFAAMAAQGRPARGQHPGPIASRWFAVQMLERA